MRAIIVFVTGKPPVMDTEVKLHAAFPISRRNGDRALTMLVLFRDTQQKNGVRTAAWVECWLLMPHPFAGRLAPNTRERTMSPEELLSRVCVGMTRDEVVAALGPPDDMGGTSRKYRTPRVYRYGRIEVYFEPWKAGRLHMVYTEDDEGNWHVLLER